MIVVAVPVWWWSQVMEADDNWTFDSLLNEVSQEMQKDADEREELQKAEGA